MFYWLLYLKLELLFLLLLILMKCTRKCKDDEKPLRVQDQPWDPLTPWLVKIMCKVMLEFSHFLFLRVEDWKMSSNISKSIFMFIKHHHPLLPLIWHIKFAIISESGSAEELQPIESGLQYVCDKHTAITLMSNICHSIKCWWEYKSQCIHPTDLELPLN